MGRAGSASKWARAVTPEQRRAATQAARDARWASLLRQAAEMEGGDTLTPEQLAERARRLQTLHMARARARRRPVVR